MTTKYRYLTDEDIFDFYGLAALRHAKTISEEDLKIAEDRIHKIRDIYVVILKERIRAEARFLGVKDLNLSLRDIINDVNELLDKQVESQVDSMIQMGSGFDFRQITQHTSQQLETKADIARPESFLNDKKWKIIAEACVQVEEATTTGEIVIAIDYLNDLQHNSFHVLIDLQSGRMLDNAGKSHHDSKSVLDEVMNLKTESRSIFDIIHRMSQETQDILNKYKKDPKLK